MTTEPTSEADLDRVVVSDIGDVFTVRQLHERVTWLEPGVLLMREIPGGGTETLRVMTSRWEALAADVDVYGAVVDLAESVGGILTSEYRKFIPKHFTELSARSDGRLKLIAVAFTGSQVARVASKFLIGRITGAPMTIEKDREHARMAVCKALGKSA